MDTLEICNKIRLQAQGVSDNGVPIDAFPAKIQQIILDFAANENFLVEYTFTSFISAVASAIGNSCQIRIKGNWVANPALYLILVGRAGLGKTPPLEASFKPIRALDMKNFISYKAEMEAINDHKDKNSEEIIKPKLRRTIVSDFTPEALMRAHNDNPRGITILVDEIIGMFNSVNQYNRGQLIEQLLTAFSGGALNIIRVNNPIPIYIECPCINIVGTIQTKLVYELFKNGYQDNGLLDRILFVIPRNQKISSWIDSCDDTNSSIDAAKNWTTIINKIQTLEYNCTDNEDQHTTILTMDKDAKKYFFEWRNKGIDKVNETMKDEDVKNRVMKQPLIVAKLALIIQVMRWACGESHLHFVDVESVKSAIRIDDFFEESYSRIEKIVVAEQLDPLILDLLDLLPDQFETKLAKKSGEQIGLSPRTVMYYISESIKVKAIKRVKHGKYKKLFTHESSE